MSCPYLKTKALKSIDSWLTFYKPNEKVLNFHTLDLGWDDWDDHHQNKECLNWNTFCAFIENDIDNESATSIAPIIRPLARRYEETCWMPAKRVADSFFRCLKRIESENVDPLFENETLILAKETEEKMMRWKMNENVEEEKLKELLVSFHSFFSMAEWKKERTVQFTCVKLHGLLQNVPIKTLCAYLSNKIGIYELFLLLPFALVLLDYYSNDPSLIDAFASAFNRTGLKDGKEETIDAMTRMVEKKILNIYKEDEDRAKLNEMLKKESPGSFIQKEGLKAVNWKEIRYLSCFIPFISPAWYSDNALTNEINNANKARLRQILADVDPRTIISDLNGEIVPLDDLIFSSRLLGFLCENYGMHDGDWGDSICMTLKEKWKGKSFVLKDLIENLYVAFTDFQFIHDRDDFPSY